jgi:ABC-2 type transport system permease protein
MLWSAGLVAVAALMISVYPTVRDNPSLNDLVKQYPDALKNLVGFGGPLDYASPAGYLGAELFSFMVPLLLIIATVAAGSGAIAGEEENGTMELLLALPIMRGRLVLEKLAALIAEVVALGAVLWLALWVGAAVVDMRISGAHLASGTAGSVLVAILFGALSMALGAATGRRSLAIGLTSALAVAAFLVNVLAPLVDSLSEVRRLSPFYHYAASDPLRHGLDAGDVAFLVVTAALFAVAATLAFQRRDIAN